MTDVHPILTIEPRSLDDRVELTVSLRGYDARVAIAVYPVTDSYRFDVIDQKEVEENEQCTLILDNTLATTKIIKFAIYPAPLHLDGVEDKCLGGVCTSLDQLLAKKENTELSLDLDKSYLLQSQSYYKNLTEYLPAVATSEFVSDEPIFEDVEEGNAVPIDEDVAADAAIVAAAAAADAAAVAAAAVDISINLLLAVECRNLPQRNWLSANDSMVAIFAKMADLSRFEYLDQTEWIKGCNDPTFIKDLLVEHVIGGGQQLKFCVYDIISEEPEYSEKDQLGSVEVQLDTLSDCLNKFGVYECSFRHDQERMNEKLQKKNSKLVIRRTQTSPVCPELPIPEVILEQQAVARRTQEDAEKETAEREKAEEERDERDKRAKATAQRAKEENIEQQEKVQEIELCDNGWTTLPLCAGQPEGKTKMPNFNMTRQLGLFQCRLLEFRVRCRNLLQMNWLFANDPVVAVFYKLKDGQLKFASRTKFLENTNNPNFDTPLQLEYHADARQVIRLCVYNSPVVSSASLLSKEPMCWVELQLHSVVQEILTGIQPRDNGDPASSWTDFTTKLQCHKARSPEPSITLTLIQNRAVQVDDYRHPSGGPVKSADKSSKCLYQHAHFFDMSPHETVIGSPPLDTEKAPRYEQLEKSPVERIVDRAVCDIPDCVIL